MQPQENRRSFLRRFGLARAKDVDELRGEVVALQSRDRRFRKQRDEIGSGVEITYGEYEAEKTKALTGSDKWDTLEEMQTDAHVKASLRFVTLPLLLADWDIVAASDSARDIEIAEFCKANLLRKQTDRFGKEFWCDTSWQGQRLREILEMLASGFSMFYPTMKVVSGRYRVFDRIIWLEPRSVDPRGWNLSEDDRLIEVARTYTTPGGKYLYQDPIPANELMLYVWDLKGARFEGTPFIRSLYGPWYRKSFYQRMGAIWAQKIGAPVPFGVHPSGWPPEVKAKFQQFVRSIRGTAQANAWGAFEFSKDGKAPEIHFAGAREGEVDRMGSLIDGENREMAHAAGRKSQMLGETSTGSRALGDSLGSAEDVAVQAVAEMVCEFENHGAGDMPGMIPRVVDANFYGVKNYPSLTYSGLSPNEGLEHLDGKIRAWKAGIIPHIPEARKQIVSPLGIELKDEDYDVEPVVIPKNHNADEEKQNDDERQEAALRARDDFIKRITPLLAPVQEGAPKGGGFRHRNHLEVRILNLAAIQETYRVGERDILSALRETRTGMVKDLMGRLKAGKITARNMESQRRSKYRGSKKAHESLVEAFRRTGESGIGHVEEELKRGGGNAS